MPKTRTLLAIVLLPLLLFLVACGGDDDDSDSSSGDQPTATESNGSSDDDSAADDEDSDANDDEDDDSSDADPSGEEILANCPELLGMFGAFTGGAFTNPGTGDAEEDLQALVEIFQNAADNAPSEIQADMQVMANVFADFYSALDEFDIDLSNPASIASLSAEQQAEFTAALESLDTPEIQQASENLNTYFNENCS